VLQANGQHNYDQEKTIQLCFGIWHCPTHSHAGDVMSDYMELINPQTMMGKLLKHGEVIAEYKMEQCDSCSSIVRIDPFGWKISTSKEKMAWFCGGCR
jgi:hypothetical protein